LNSGEMSRVVHGTSDSDAGSPLWLPGSGEIWGDDRGHFLTADNAVWHLTHETASPTSSKLEIANPGFSSLVTSGASTAVSITHAHTCVNAGIVTPAGFAVFSYRQNGVLTSEASVPAAHAIRSGRIVASAAGAVNTGIALANTNAVTATISF